MTIEFPCSQCLQPLRVPDASAGKSARCPKCQAISPVPQAGQSHALSSERARPPVQQPATAAPAPPAVPAAAPPAASANDALFAMLKAATTPQPPSLPRPPETTAPFVSPASLPSASNPFAGSQIANMSVPPNLNPYASPAEAYAYQVAGAAVADRPGLPWEVEGAGIVSWWKTSQMCLTDSAHAFRIMRLEGGIGSPFLFAMLGMMIGLLGQIIWQVPMFLLAANVGNAAARQEALIEGFVQIGVQAGSTLAMATVGLFLSAILFHLCLMALSGANRSFETTYRVVAFTNGSLAWLQVVPCIGGLIVLVMHFVCLINGLAQAQQTSMGKAAAAVFLPLGLCVIAIVGLAILVVAIAVNS